MLAAGTITPASALGVNVFAQARTHLVIDTTGYFITAERAAPATTPATTPVFSTSYKFSVAYTDGSYARWNPCQSIQVKVSFTGAQPHARIAFDNAIEQARQATDLDLVVTEVPSIPAPANGQITVRWGTSADNSSLTGSVLGIGGFSYAPGQIVRGSVIIRSDLPFNTTHNGEDVLTGTLAHELGHAIGLSHVTDPTQLMYAYANGWDEYQAGDLSGLRLLGVQPGCIPYPVTRAEGPHVVPDPIGDVVVIDVVDVEGPHTEH